MSGCARAATGSANLEVVRIRTTLLLDARPHLRDLRLVVAEVARQLLLRCGITNVKGHVHALGVALAAADALNAAATTASR